MNPKSVSGSFEGTQNSTAPPHNTVDWMSKRRGRRQRKSNWVKKEGLIIKVVRIKQWKKIEFRVAFGVVVNIRHEHRNGFVRGKGKVRNGTRSF